MGKITTYVILITIVSKLFGFAREIALSYVFGASNISDAYLIAITIPGIIFGFVAAGLSAGYIPLFSKIEHEEGSKQATLFTNNLINITIIISTLFILFGVLFTPTILYVLAPGFDSDTAQLAVTFTRLTMITIYFTGLITILSGYLHVKGSFFIVSMIGLPLSIFTIASFFLANIYSLNFLAYGYVLGVFFQLVMLIWVTLKKKFKYQILVDLKNPHMVSLLAVVIPIIIGVSVNQINVVVDRSLASGLEVGAISALNYAQRLNGFIQGVFILPITTVLYPMMSKFAATNETEAFKDSITKTILALIIFIIPATVGAIFLATPIVTVLFARGAFTELATQLTSSSLFYYSFGMISFGVTDILVKAFYSLQDTKTPVKIGIFGVGLNVVLNLMLYQILGVGGLALATSLTATTVTLLLFTFLRKKIGTFHLRYLGITFIKVSIASLLMILVVNFIFSVLLDPIGITRALLLAILIGVVIYLILIYFMKIKEIEEVLQVGISKLKKV